MKCTSRGCKGLLSQSLVMPNYFFCKDCKTMKLNEDYSPPVEDKQEEFDPEI